MASYDAPYAGLKVVDLSQGLAAPYCGMLLAQHGADVIKVEPPNGDWSRILNQNYGDHTAYSITGNLGKRSVALDIRREEGKAVLWRLLADADVLIEGFRPGVMTRLGFGYEQVAKKVPGLVYLSVTGFGDDHPLSSRPAMDPVLQAYTGLVLANKGGDGVPQRVPYSAVDTSAALYAFQVLSAALYARRQVTEGRHLRVSLLQAAAAMQAVRIVATFLDSAAAPVSTPPSGSYQVSDGWLQIQVVKEDHWHQLCAVLRAPELAMDERFCNRNLRNKRRDEVYDVLRPLFATWTLADLDAALTQAGILHERLNSYADFLAQERAMGTDTIAWLDEPDIGRQIPMPNIPGREPWQAGDPRSRSPARGEHTEDVLGAHGFTADQIDRLRRDGVLAPPAADKA